MITVAGQNSAAGNSVALPAHQAGDIIYIAAARTGSTTAPTVPAASGTVPQWKTETSGGANSLALVTAAARASGSNHTSGTWTNANQIAVQILRTDLPLARNRIADGVSAQGNGNNATSVVYPALKLESLTSNKDTLGIRVAVRATAQVFAVPANWTLTVSQPAGASALLAIMTRAHLTANPTADTVTHKSRCAWRAMSLEAYEFPTTSVWDGSQWLDANPKMWDGSAWQPTQVFDGSAWIPL